LEENIDKPLTLEIIKNYNSLIVTGLKSKYSGDLRQTNVFINNTVYSPPDFRGLERLVDNGLKEIEMLDGNINKAFSYLLMISKLQVFIDGNKRTALLSAIHHLAYSKQPLLMFFSDFTQEYLKSLKHFYETGDNEPVSGVLYKQLDINR
ncbi:MAG: Fic family protein, partial [Paraclostridium sp.]